MWNFRKNEKKETNTSKLKGILIEDLKKIANRLQSKPLENVRIHPAVLNDTSMLRFELFQFMISNTDWSARIPTQYQTDCPGFKQICFTDI